jgi:opacity protein-like surface antigen
VGAQLYYKLTDWVAAGFEGSYEIEDEVAVKGGGPFEVPIYNTHFRTHGAQAVLAVRLGGWIYGVRPYVMAGLGPYMRSMAVTSELNDPDDADHPPVEAGSRTDTYASSLIGGGIDIQVMSSGSIGLAIQYQRAYAPGHGIQYVIPQAHFDYHF